MIPFHPSLPHPTHLPPSDAIDGEHDFHEMVDIEEQPLPRGFGRDHRDDAPWRPAAGRRRVLMQEEHELQVW
jgi:hypothetical protein